MKINKIFIPLVKNNSSDKLSRDLELVLNKSKRAEKIFSTVVDKIYKLSVLTDRSGKAVLLSGKGINASNRNGSKNNQPVYSHGNSRKYETALLRESKKSISRKSNAEKKYIGYELLYEFHKARRKKISPEINEMLDLLIRAIEIKDKEILALRDEMVNLKGDNESKKIDQIIESRIRELKQGIRWNGKMNEAADEIIKQYYNDLKLPVEQRMYKDLKNASDEFYDCHEFKDKPKPAFTKKMLYENVKKAHAINLGENRGM